MAVMCLTFIIVKQFGVIRLGHSTVIYTLLYFWLSLL